MDKSSDIPKPTDDICLFLSTDEFDPVSAFIRRFTNCDWSHAGFYSKEQNSTYSAMADGQGLTWRPIKPSQHILLLEAPGTEEALNLATTWSGEKYDYRDIAGILLGANWQTKGRLICDVTLFKAFRLSGYPLVNPTFIPEEHLTPRDLLLSSVVTLHGDLTESTRAPKEGSVDVS